MRRTLGLTPACVWFLVAFGVSCVGAGTVYPLLAVYLTSLRPDGSPKHAAIYYLIAASAGIVLSLTVARCKLWQPRVVCMWGLFFGAVGYSLLALGAGNASVLGAAVAVGVGNGAFYSGLAPLLVGLNAGGATSRLFGARAVVANLGVGIGALIAGRYAADLSLYKVKHLLLVNAATSLVPLALIALLAVSEQSDASSIERPTHVQAGPVKSQVFNVVAFHFGVSTFAFVLFETAVPQWLIAQLHVGLPLVTALVALNTALVVLLQLPIASIIQPRRPLALLLAVPLLLITSFGFAATATAYTGVVRSGLLVAFAVIFTLAECLFGAVLQPAILSAVGSEGFARTNALVSASFNAALLLGPATSVLLVASFPPLVSVALWALGCLVTCIPAVRMSRVEVDVSSK